MIRTWDKIKDALGPEALQHTGQNKCWTADEKVALSSKVNAGNSLRAVACQAGINNSGLVYTCLIPTQKGRPSMKKRPPPPNRYQPKHLHESDYEKLIRLRAENEYIRTEIAVIKKKSPERRKTSCVTQGEKQRLSGTRLGTTYRSYKGAVGKTAGNIINRNFKAESPLQKWTTDVSQVSFAWGKCYLSPLIYRSIPTCNKLNACCSMP